MSRHPFNFRKRRSFCIITLFAYRKTQTTYNVKFYLKLSRFLCKSARENSTRFNNNTHVANSQIQITHVAFSSKFSEMDTAHRSVSHTRGGRNQSAFFRFGSHGVCVCSTFSVRITVIACGKIMDVSWKVWMSRNSSSGRKWRFVRLFECKCLFLIGEFRNFRFDRCVSDSKVVGFNLDRVLGIFRWILFII